MVRSSAQPITRRQEDEFLLQPDVGDIGHPQLVHSRQRHLSRQIRVDFAAMVGVGGHHELPFAETQQVIFP
jgi:hypothetical protein